MESKLKEILQYMDEHKADMLQDYKTLVNMKDFWKDAADVNAVGQWLKKAFEQEGFHCQLIDVGDKAGKLLVGLLGSERPGKPVMFCGHMDTALDSFLYKDDPFYIEDGKAYGPGVLDMKGGILISLYTVKALNAAGWQGRPIKILYASDEEGFHDRSHCENRMIKESKGLLMAFNMETGLMDKALCIGRKGRLGLDVIVDGVSAHSGNDFTAGINAIEEMAHKIIDFQGLTDLEVGTTVSVGTIKGGTIANAIPAQCVLSVDVRFKTMAEGDRVKQLLQRVCKKTYIAGTKTQAAITGEMAPYETTDGVMKLYDFVRSTVSNYGFGDISCRAVGGSSDAAYVTMAGTPILCSCGAIGEWNHTTKEYVLVDSLFERVGMFAAVIMESDHFAL